MENTRRLLLFFSPNGVIHRHWRPTGGLRDFAFPQGSVLEPLSRHRDDLVVIDGLNFLTGNNHEGGQAAMLTNRGGGSTPTRGMSLDQFIASQIGASDRFSSLEFGVLTDIWGAGQQTRISYRGPGELVHPDADPRRAFTRLFGAIGGGRGAEDRLRSRRQGILDLARGELADLHRRVGRVEQAKLEAHLASLASVEQGLFAGPVGGCDAPLAPDPLNKDQNDNVPALLDAQMRLAVTALSCGQTKVASVQLSHTVSPVVFTWAGNNEGHHSLSKTGDLLDPVVFEAQIARLLADEQSAVTMAAFTERWLGIDQLPNVSRDVETYPSLSPQVRMAMTASTARFIRELWRSGGSLADLFEADHGWLNPALAEHLDVQLGDGPESPEGLLRTSLVGTQYGGILTHPSVLTTFALSTTSSPIHRGLFVRERFLCQDLPPPPANLDTSPRG